MTEENKKILDYIKKKGLSYPIILENQRIPRTELEKVTQKVLDLCKSEIADLAFLKELLLYLNDRNYKKLNFIIAYYNHHRSEEFCEFMLANCSSAIEEFLVGVISYQNILKRYYNRTDRNILLRVIDNKNTEEEVLNKLKSSSDKEIVDRVKFALYSMLE